MSRTRRAALGLSTVSLVFLVCLTGPAYVKARSTPAASSLKAHFTRFGVGQLIGSGNHVLVFDPSRRRGVLVNPATGHRTVVTAPGCLSPVAIGGASIVFDCGPSTDPSRLASYENYNIDSGGLSPFTVPPFSGVVAVGRDWVSLAGICADSEHCAQSYSLENLASGAVVSDPTNAATMIDLDSPNPAHTVCTPVTVPTNGQGNPESPAAPYGSVVSDGRFQIATSNGGSYLEKCGAKLHQLLTYTSYPGCAHQTCAPPFTSHAIIWQSKPGRLSGVFLPSLKHFAISVPARVDPQAASERFVNGNKYSLALTTHTVYLGVRNVVWTMPIPTGPPKPTRSPKKS